jgi:salicylate hydroxylase
LRVIIIGAGLGGLAAANALRQRGFDVAVYERADNLGEVGAGVQLGPNAVKVLRALGLEEPLRRHAFEPNNRYTLNWNDSSLRNRWASRAEDAALYGAPYMTAHRADLHKVLQLELPASSIHLGKACIEARTRGDVAVALFSDGSQAEGDVVVGADGIRSIIRAGIAGQDRPRFTNSMCWRCIVPISCVPERLGPKGELAVEKGDHLSWYGPNGQVICYPIGDGSMLNIFAGHSANGWVDESWTIPSSRTELLDAYAGWSPSLLGMLALADDCFKWGIFDRDPIEQWTKGRVTLLGDAAHPTMPNLAQGANMAIEDGYVLARNLSKHTDVDAALAGYFQERQPRTKMITLKSRENFQLSMQWPPAPAIDRSWIFRFDATREPA